MKQNDFKIEKTTVWSFPDRGKWATHNSKYRGNFAPQVARNLIEKYTLIDELVLDPMVGSGTTLIEAKLLKRNAIGIDINPHAVKISKQALEFETEYSSCKQIVKLGDARNLQDIKNSSVDLIIVHPPYWNIIEYSKGEIVKDLSNIASMEEFLNEIKIVAGELFRTLKPNKYCAVLIGDTRKAQHYIPLSYYLLQCFMKSGFVLKEEIIKIQHNCSYSKKWEESADKWGFYLIMHEHLFVFRKPHEHENLSKVKLSTII